MVKRRERRAPYEKEDQGLFGAGDGGCVLWVWFDGGEESFYLGFLYGFL
jgi:hypothetical protein